VNACTRSFTRKQITASQPLRRLCDRQKPGGRAGLVVVSEIFASLSVVLDTSFPVKHLGSESPIDLSVAPSRGPPCFRFFPVVILVVGPARVGRIQFNPFGKSPGRLVSSSSGNLWKKCYEAEIFEWSGVWMRRFWR
jgi:hypothetical protein